MKKGIFTVLFVFVATLAMNAQNPAPQSTPANPNAPKIVFKETEHSFGEVDEGPKVTHEFAFKNTGKEPLVLSNVKASCGCTTPAWPKEPILPGQDGKILVTYNTQGRPGSFTKTITVTSNAAENVTILTIKGSVKQAPDINATPVKEGNMLNPENGN